MYPHRIRLHGPWQFEPLVRTVVHPDGHIEAVPGPLPTSGRLKIPTAWRGTVLDGFRGRVRWTRRFHSPRTLEPEERLWLVFEGVDYFADVSLNGSPLGRHEGYFDRFEFEVTELVAARNELAVEVDCPAEADLSRRRLIRGTLDTRDPGFVAGLWRDVALEVRSLAFLRDVWLRAAMAESSSVIAVSGRVVGEPGVPLMLDLSIDDVPVATQRTEASPDGTEFRLESRIEPVRLWWPRNLGEPQTYRAKLELHGRARTLDSVVCSLGFYRLSFDVAEVAQLGVAFATARLNGRDLPVVLSDFDRPDDPLWIARRGFDDLPDSSSRCNDCLVLYRCRARVLAPWLYEAADSCGLFLWQDLPLSGTYSSDWRLCREAARQARSMVRQLGSHPCLALWGCHDRSSAENAELDRAVQMAISEIDSSRMVILAA